MATICPCCGHVSSKTPVKRSALPERATLDAALAARELTQPEYFAQCKRIGLRDDLRFLLHVTALDMSDELRAEAHALVAELETRASKPADAKAINRLRDRYRIAKGSLVVYAPRKAA